MDQRPEQPPEGRLIAAAAERLDLSIRESARRAGISYGRWRQIAMGYQNISPGVYAPVHAPAKTLARMASVVGVTADQMETEGLRPDAAEFMRREMAPAPPRLAVVPAPLAAVTVLRPEHLEPREGDVIPDMDAEMKVLATAHYPDVEKPVIAAYWPETEEMAIKAAIDGPDIPGSVIFRDSQYPGEARRWDVLVQVGHGFHPGEGFSLWQLAWLMSIGRANDDARRAGNTRVRAGEILAAT